LGFLGPGRLLAKTPNYEGWLSLDFLGFSRQKRDLSMGYTGFSLENFSRALLPFSTTRRTGARSRGHAEAQDSPSGKLKLFFDFPEDIVAAPFPLATRFDARRNGSALMQSKDVRCKCNPRFAPVVSVTAYNLQVSWACCASE
jgi:hypothetical protein